ncbi:MAG TPA: Gmad2 immunoglobulin-like domain-containing protein [Acidimicrobiia bacterium]
MSYERKMKDLMARLVSMSPEPPPFPEEEAPMARQREQRKSRPALVFATAAVLVVVLAVPLLLFTGEGEPDPAATTSTTSTTLTPTTTTTEPGTSTTEFEGTTWTGVAYLYQEPENSFQSNPALVPLQMEVKVQSGAFEDVQEFTRALAALTESGAGPPAGFRNAIPPDVRAESMDEVGGQVGADMNEAFLDGAGGLLADYTMLNQLIYTLTYQTPDAEVLFTVNGQPVESFGSEGLDLTEPVTRDSFIDELNAIFLTEPITAGLDRYFVAGRANVFEASLMARVLDGNDEVVYEEPVQATCGSGCWGDFSTSIESELIVPGESSIMLFTYSAEDGSIVEAITIPIPEGDVWRLTAGG